MVTLRASWTGDRVEIQVPTYELDERKKIVVTGTAIQGGQQSVGTVGPGGGVELLYHRPSGEGWIFAKTDDNVLSKPYVANGDFRDSAAVVSTSSPGRGESYVPEETVDPSNYAGIVNADNEEGIALAPALRREGASLGPEGATVTLPDGETVDVGAISEADEVARYLQGDGAGDVVDADQPAVDTGSSSGGGGGMIGGAVAVVLALLVGAAALLGGVD
jgi:hypothetical protein